MRKIKILMSCMLILLLISCGQKACAQDESEAVLRKNTYLSDLEPISSTGSYLEDINPEKNPISLQGIQYQKGLCVSSVSELSYNLNGEYTQFKCIIGHHDDYLEYKGLLVFRVFVDGEKLYESKQMGVGSSEEVKVMVKDANRLTLTVEDNGEGSLFVVWADAVLFK